MRAMKVRLSLVPAVHDKGQGLDNRPIGSQVPGPLALQIQSAWSEMVGIDFVDQALSHESL